MLEKKKRSEKLDEAYKRLVSHPSHDDFDKLELNKEPSNNSSVRWILVGVVIIVITPLIILLLSKLY